MSAASWDEIKRLAADFQRAQLNSTIQRLSERNCVEIIWKLKELNLLELLYTTDGKEYLTPQELIKEIREELVVHGGRVGVVDIAQNLNVDFAVVETKVSEIVRSDRNLTLILGQLIDLSYFDQIADEINDRLQEYGLVTIADLTKEYNLPGDVLTQVVQDRLGSTIKGQVDVRDRGNIFTELYVEKNKAIIRGALCAVTRPTNVSNIMHAAGIQEGLFYTIFDDLLSSNQLAGSLMGSRTDKAQFVPDVYTRAQNEWVEAFYAQNGYLEYDSMARLGISEPASYARKKFKNEKILYLSSCCVGHALTDRLEAEIDEIIFSNSWVDVTSLVPSVLSTNDVNQLLQVCLKTKTGAQILCDTIVISEKMIQDVVRSFDTDILVKAERDIVANPSLLMAGSDKRPNQNVDKAKEDKKDQRRQKAAGGSKGGSGAGSHGREVKTKSVKKKNLRSKDADDSEGENDEEYGNKVKSEELEYMAMELLEQKLKSLESIKEAPEDMITQIAETLYRPLNRKYQEALKTVFLQTSGTATGSGRRKIHAELSEKITSQWTNIYLFSKSFSHFSGDVQQSLIKHLLKTLCTEVTNLTFLVLSSDSMVTGENDLTAELRSSILAKLSDEKVKTSLTKLNSCLSGKSMEEFEQHFEELCGINLLNITLRKPDKKKERQLVFSHRQALLEQLNCENNLAASLHLTCMVLFEVFFQCMLHAPGRLVPQLIGLFKDHMTEENLSLLTHCQDVVVKQLRSGGDAAKISDDASVTINSDELVVKLRSLASSVKKSIKTQQQAGEKEEA